MRVINHLTEPGGVKRVDLSPDTVEIHTTDGGDRLYKLASTILVIRCMYCKKRMGEKDGKGVSGTSHSICPECWESQKCDRN